MKWNTVSNVWMKGCVAGLMIAGAASAGADENDQAWLTGGVKYTLTDQLSLKAAEQARFRDESQYYRHTDLGVGYKMSRSWSAAGTFRLLDKKSSSGDWKRSNGYLLDVIHTAGVLGAELKSRMRLAVFDPQYDADSTSDLRPRFDLSPAKALTGWKLKPYVADELMVSLDERELYRNRLIAGLKCRPCSHLALDLFVMNEQTEKNEKWSENWNTGLAATLSF